MAPPRHFVVPTTLLAFACLFCTVAFADAGRFDLTGPRIEVRVTRGGHQLPIASVPNLQPGDQIWLHPDLPATQSVHYLLVAVFLRGNTNPPPDEWFTRIETWNKRVREEGATITVPEEAQQALLFLAPETGGDFPTLRSAVRGRPGIFVRASQDLAEAGFEQARIEKYLASMRQVPPSDPGALLEHSTLLSRTLNLKPNQDCFKRPVDQQYTCLTQSGSQSLLDDGHGQTIVSSLVSGPGSDFINAASATSLAGGGNYSAYVGAVVDLVRLTSGLHTAHYQYIPAIAFPQDQSLNLRLNTPPSFQNPKSVIVIGLPSVQAAVTPPLRPSDPQHVSCLLQPNVVLPVEGAPLVFSTSFAHDLTLRIDGPGSASDIPVTADAYLGGLVLAPSEHGSHLGEAKPLSNPVSTSRKDAPSNDLRESTSVVTGTVKGQWGFDPFTGPTVKLQAIPGVGWRFSGTAPQIISGQPNHLILTADGTACLRSVTAIGPEASNESLPWKLDPATTMIDLTVTPSPTAPPTLQFAIHQYGEPAPQILDAQTFSKPAELTSLEFHAGDQTAILKGSGLAQVKQLQVGALRFEPHPATEQQADVMSSSALALTLINGERSPQLDSGAHVVAEITLKDGRLLNLPFHVGSPRPTLSVLSKTFEVETPTVIQLTSKDDIPLDSRLTVSLRLATKFAKDSQIEISTVDGTMQAKLNVAEGSLILQDNHTVLARIDLLKSFGNSAFGQLQLRMTDPSGSSSDWLPLGNLIRLPRLQQIQCPSDPVAPCTLSGSSLFLLGALANDQTFSNPTVVPEGFVESSITIPHVTGTGLFLKLRDDPTVIDSASLPVTTQ